MSRIGKQPIAVPGGVTVNIDGQNLAVKGPKGEMSMTLVDEVTLAQGEDGLTVTPRDETQRARAMWGMQRTLVQNIVTGVTEGFTKRLEINGVGYRAQMQGKDLQLALGFSHDVVHKIPEGIQVKTPSPTMIEISGTDKQTVGQVAAEIRAYRPPEPYKGKGVKYEDEYIFRKEGKKK
ncbi:MAG: 50S ribosomal protein L6 [Parvibaculum sp.]|jgi:large subunit ribosomal protein L6|nr:50S ribosomal protein L6 [Parvibaculum sp.]|tara:strand:+ start:6198 stop:6731 length:534 start_codon:yes stop_codon:yes gene_type:complete